MKIFAMAALLAALTAAPFTGAHAGNLSLGIDPMVLEFGAPYGGEAHANVTVTNGSDSDELVYARPIDWRTTQSGDVVFERPGTERNHSLTSSLKLEPANFLLHAGETRQITVTLQMPSVQGAAPALWGGFIVRAASSGAAASAMPGGTILVYDTVGSPRRHVGLSKLFVTQDSSHRAQVTAGLLNDGDTYVRPLVRVIVQRGERVVRDKTVPCSVIFAGDRRTLTAPLDGLAAGAYRIHFLLDYGGESIVDGVTNATIR